MVRDDGGLSVPEGRQDCHSRAVTLLTRLALVAAAGLLTGAVVATDGLAGVRALGASDGSHPAAPRPALVGEASGVGGRDALAGALGARAAALLRRDRTAWLAGTDPTMRGEQGALFDRITALPVAGWAYRLTSLTAAGDGDYRVRAELSYRLAGDTRQVRRERSLVVVRRGGGWLVRSDTAAEINDRALWDLGPLSVRRGARGVVVALGGASSAVGSMVEDVDAAAAAVDAVWGTAWPRTVVAVLPADLAEMTAVLGRDDDRGLAQLAAVTSGPLDRGRTGPDAVAAAADRVVLNPDVWARLTPVGRRVVLTHELTHVATRATTDATPATWLDEGLADYIAYRGSRLPASTVAADALREVRAGRVPPRLPTASQFDPARGDPAPAYAQAWVACDLIARRVGVAGLVRLYRIAASSGGGAPRAAEAVRTVLGEGPAAFLGDWQAALRSLAGSGA